MSNRPQRLRCAIYTRKSTEEGLDQDFNSLDAQYEACSAYIASQRHEGWSLLPARYDDGGFSGGNMDRPGLTQLLAEVRAGRVDVIVVYKVDRLTRSLMDFAKIVEALDGAGASFVSITQSFNTTTSMGRLTLNVLLSFAQFEREVISERVRDKVAASKARGMWMGGVVPLGYDVVDRKLVPNEAEAATVRQIMQRYLEVGCVRMLRDELVAVGIVGKHRKLHDGTVRDGAPLSRGALYHLLKNKIYVGLISHKDKVYLGEHPAIIDEILFEAVRQRLACSSAHGGKPLGSPRVSILSGLVRDGAGRLMSPGHAVKAGKRYRYYATANCIRADGAARINAAELERAVLQAIYNFIASDALLACTPSLPADQIDGVQRTRAQLLKRWDQQTTTEHRVLCVDADLRIEVTAAEVHCSISAGKLLQRLGGKDADGGEHINLNLPTTIRSYGHAKRLRIVPVRPAASVSDDLIGKLRDAAKARDELLSISSGQASGSAAEIRDLRRRARLSFLSPSIVTTIIDGTQSRFLTARKLARVGTLPLCWDQQKIALAQL